VFYGIYQLGWYLDTFYDLVASSEELSLVFAIPQERPGQRGEAPRDGSVRFRDVDFDGVHLDFAIAGGEQAVILAEPGVENTLALLLKRHITPTGGIVSIGGSELGSFNMYLLRSAVMVLNRPTIVDVTLREYLTLAEGRNGDGATTMRALERVGLLARLASLPNGLDTQLASSGSPLSIVEVMQLKLANALLSKPRVVMSQLFDMMPLGVLRATLAELRQNGTTVLLSSGRPRRSTSTPGTGLARESSAASPTRPRSCASSPNGRCGHDAGQHPDGAFPSLARLRPPRAW
jgi:putative ABC transport system ATP-binding protein